MFLVKTVCPICGKAHYVNVDPVGYYKWSEQGELIQNALPSLSPDERELLISGIDSACWNKMFSA